MGALILTKRPLHIKATGITVGLNSEFHFCKQGTERELTHKGYFLQVKGIRMMILSFIQAAEGI